MKIIEIQPLSNGAHRNQNGGNICPDGYAVIPDSVAIPETFPFVDITVDNATPPVVLTMTANQAAYDAAKSVPADPTPDPIADHDEAIAELTERVINLELGGTSV